VCALGAVGAGWPPAAVAGPLRSQALVRACCARAPTARRTAHPHAHAPQGYGNEDPSESLRQGWDNLRAKWDAWPADDRCVVRRGPVCVQRRHAHHTPRALHPNVCVQRRHAHRTPHNASICCCLNGAGTNPPPPLHTHAHAVTRNRTLAWGAGGLLVLYLANGLINAIDRLPLLPAALQLIGFGYSAWFTWRCVCVCVCACACVCVCVCACACVCVGPRGGGALANVHC
jgi:hypothetical protein